MAIMSDPDRVAVHKEMMADLSRDRTTVPSAIKKADIRAAVDAADQWASDNAASFNTALPVAFRNNATAAQKAMLLEYVIRKRYILGT